MVRRQVVIEPVSAENLCKMGISADRPETFSLPGLEDREPGDNVELAKSLDFRACEVQVVNSRELQDWLARAAGIESPNW
ncbi:hypothetical protein ACVWWG_005110 [Bradyrhizobium sp. LB7.2]